MASVAEMSKEMKLVQVEIKQVESNLSVAIERRQNLQKNLQSNIEYYRGMVVTTESELKYNSEALANLSSQFEDCKSMKNSSLAVVKEKLKKAVSDSKKALSSAINGDQIYSKEVCTSRPF